jgi:hypothetical protein
MREAGYDFSVLFGLDDFYHRFGYTRAWSDTSHNVRTADLPREAPRGPLRPFRFVPRADLARLYNRHYANATGTAVRPTYTRAATRHERQGYLWTGRAGRAAGYVAVLDQGARMEVIETVGETEQVLRAVGRLARRFGADDVRFSFLPYDTPLARRLRQGNCTMETRCRRRGAAMARVIHLRRVLERLSGELGRRLRRSALAGWRGRLEVADHADRVVLDIARGRVVVAPPAARAPHAMRCGDEMAQFVLGTSDALEIVGAHGVRLRGEARLLLPVLFPEQHPMLHLADYF